MKKILSLFAIVIAFQFTLKAQSTFQKVISIAGYPSFISTNVHQCSDGGFLLSGYDYASNNHGMVIKMDAAFQVEWMKDFSGSAINGFYMFNIGECIGGGYYASGYSYDFNNSAVTVFLLKMDNSGTILWNQQYLMNSGQSIYANVAPKVRQLPTGEFLICTAMWESMGIIKTDASGNVEVAESFRGDSIEPKDPGLDAIATSDGGIMCAGKRGNDPYFVKTDASGNVQWNKIFTMTNYYNRLYRMIQTSDGGFLLAGMKFDLTLGTEAGFIMKMDIAGNVLWYKEYSTPDQFWFTDMKLLSNGNLLLSGYSMNSSQQVIIITDQNGVVQSSHSLGLPSLSYNYFLYSGLEVSATDEVLYTYSYVDYSTNISTTYMYKATNLNFAWCDVNNYPLTESLNSYTPAISSNAIIQPLSLSSMSFPISQTVGVTITDYCLNSGINNPIVENNNAVFPNPFSSTATIQVDQNLIDNNTNFILYDILGNEVKTLQINYSKTEIEKGNLASGIYLYKIISNNGIIGSGKIILAD